MSKRYQVIAKAVQARLHCAETPETHQEWFERWTETIETETKNLPSGSGIDAGVQFDFEKSSPEKLVFHFGYHHMNENGFYDGWTEHSLIVTPSLQFEFSLRITGRGRNQTKDYLHEMFQYALAEEVSQ